MAVLVRSSINVKTSASTLHTAPYLITLHHWEITIFADADEVARGIKTIAEVSDFNVVIKEVNASSVEFVVQIYFAEANIFSIIIMLSGESVIRGRSQWKPALVVRTYVESLDHIRNSLSIFQKTSLYSLIRVSFYFLQDSAVWLLLWIHKFQNSCWPVNANLSAVGEKTILYLTAMNPLISHKDTAALGLICWLTYRAVEKTTLAFYFGALSFADKILWNFVNLREVLGI